MKVLFDHNVPHKLRQLLGEYSIETADAMGWATLQNGALLAHAEAYGFDVMITADKNLSYQQNLSQRKLALIVLSTNNWHALRNNTAPVLAALAHATPGSFKVITI